MSAVLLGAGAVTSIGLDAASAAAAQRAGIAGHAAHPFMVDQAGEKMIVSRVPWGGQETDGVARMVELAEPAARQAAARVPRGRVVELLLALPEPRPGLPEDFAEAVTARLTERLGLRVGTLKPHAAGHAAGLALMAEAALMLARDPEALVLVGGVDTWLVPETLEWIDGLEALHSPAMPWGFCPGEAAGFCLIGSDGQAKGRLTIQGAGEATETNRIRTETVCTGDGLTGAWRGALERVAGTTHRVDQIWCDLNGEPYRGDEIGFSVLRTREHLADEVAIAAPADCWGDVGAATGPLLVIAAAFAAAKAYAPGPLSLVSGSSMSGRRAALLLHDRGVAAGRGQ
jgi:3-oxoacyl-[acyl-carrier-protein] synthase-1